MYIKAWCGSLHFLRQVSHGEDSAEILAPSVSRVTASPLFNMYQVLEENKMLTVEGFFKIK